MGTKIEVKTTANLFDVEHSTLKSNAGGLSGQIKADHYPSFRLAGSQLNFQLTATEQTLLRPRELADLSAEAKIQILESPAWSITSKYLAGKKKVGLTTKLKNKVAKRSCESELKWSSGDTVAGEFEMRLNPKNKLQLKTSGPNADSVKWTVERGLSQLKLITVIPSKHFLLGLDQVVDNQKWDLEYNCNTGAFKGKVKVWPMQLDASTVANKDGVKPITWKVTCERAWIV